MTIDALSVNVRAENDTIHDDPRRGYDKLVAPRAKRNLTRDQLDKRRLALVHQRDAARTVLGQNVPIYGKPAVIADGMKHQRG